MATDSRFSLVDHFHAWYCDQEETIDQKETFALGSSDDEFQIWWDGVFEEGGDGMKPTTWGRGMGNMLKNKDSYNYYDI